ncbi:MAG: DUF4406 domain-containing protein [Lachnospiraceae bacterium]|nr:DUF4406 domain-containing protein [Lachnospiraceae bacterium]
MEKKDLVYICSPLSAPTKEGIQKNMKQAAHYAALVAKKLGCRTIAPHSFLPEYLEDSIPQEREVALAFGLSVLKIVQAIVVCGDRISSGMKGEIEKAKEWGIPVYSLLESESVVMLIRIEERMSTNEVQICETDISE